MAPSDLMLAGRFRYCGDHFVTDIETPFDVCLHSLCVAIPERIEAFNHEPKKREGDVLSSGMTSPT